MEKYQDFIAKLKETIGETNVLLNEPMKNHTSFKIGGCVDILTIPESYQQLAQIILLSRQYNIPYSIVGNGTNLLVRDNGIRGLIIKTSHGLNKIEVKDNIIYCEAGVLLPKLATTAMQHGLSGLEFAAGIPGTLGGAIVMNAGAYDREMKDIVVETTYIDKYGEFNTVYGDQHKFAYRKSVFQNTDNVIAYAKLKLIYGDKQTIKDEMELLNRKRREKQPLDMPSAGSTFRRPEGYYAAKLIEDCQLKGYRVGGAQVSEKHSGFIVNCGDATAEDVLNLIRYIQQTVKNQFGVELKTEVKVVGEEMR